MQWLIKKKEDGRAAATRAGYTFARILIKSTRDKFERRILSVGENVYVSVLLTYLNAPSFEKPVGVREIRSEIRKIAVGGGAKPTINPTSILSMLSFYRVEIGRRKRRLKGRLPPTERARFRSNYSLNRIHRKIDVLITFNFKIQREVLEFY